MARGRGSASWKWDSGLPPSGQQAPPPHSFCSCLQAHNFSTARLLIAPKQGRVCRCAARIFVFLRGSTNPRKRGGRWSGGRSHCLFCRDALRRSGGAKIKKNPPAAFALHAVQAMPGFWKAPPIWPLPGNVTSTLLQRPKSGAGSRRRAGITGRAERGSRAKKKKKSGWGKIIKLCRPSCPTACAGPLLWRSPSQRQGGGKSSAGEEEVSEFRALSWFSRF